MKQYQNLEEEFRKHCSIKYCTQYTGQCTFYVSLIFNTVMVFLIVLVPQFFHK